MNEKRPGLWELVIKTSTVHTITYFIMGLLASSLLNYAERFSRPEMACWMRPTDDLMVLIGPLFQPVRGLIFALALYPLRGVIFSHPRGWLITGWLLTALGILSTFGPTSGSIEGMLYTKIPIPDQLVGWLEVIPQAFLLAFIVWYWVRNPAKRWLNWVIGITFVVFYSFPILGLLVR
jgi:hypothetical protein